MNTGSEGDEPGELEGAEELLHLARKLEALSEGPMLTKETEDRIFSRIEEALDQELAPAPARRGARVREGIAALGAYLPRPLVQRRADALAMMIEDVRAGQQVAARGELAAMLAAVATMKPLPAIEPDPSFVDWLQVRLASAAAEAPTRSRAAIRVAAFNSMFRNWRLQAGLASAAASVIAVAIFALQGMNVPATRPAPDGPIAAPPVVVDDVPAVQQPDQVAQALTAPRVPFSSGGQGGLGGGGGPTNSTDSSLTPEETPSNGTVFSSAGMPEDGPRRVIDRALDGLREAKPE